MNYLAHMYLGEQSADGYVGAMLGDFVKGRVDDGRFAPAIARGIRLHRAIDKFTDEHPTHKTSRARFVPPRRRFAGIIVDICYDHFLCRRWSEFSAQPLPEFTGTVYHALGSYPGELPQRLAMILPRMARRDWLASYGDIEQLARALDGVASRVRRGELMSGAIDEVRENYGGLQADFDAFFPELARQVRDWLAAGDI